MAGTYSVVECHAALHDRAARLGTAIDILNPTNETPDQKKQQILNLRHGNETYPAISKRGKPICYALKTFSEKHGQYVNQIFLAAAFWHGNSHDDAYASHAEIDIALEMLSNNSHSLSSSLGLIIVMTQESLLCQRSPEFAKEFSRILRHQLNLTWALWNDIKQRFENREVGSSHSPVDGFTIRLASETLRSFYDFVAALYQKINPDFKAYYGNSTQGWHDMETAVFGQQAVAKVSVHSHHITFEHWHFAWSHHPQLSLLGNQSMLHNYARLLHNIKDGLLQPNSKTDDDCDYTCWLEKELVSIVGHASTVLTTYSLHGHNTSDADAVQVLIRSRLIIILRDSRRSTIPFNESSSFDLLGVYLESILLLSRHDFQKLSAELDAFEQKLDAAMFRKHPGPILSVTLITIAQIRFAANQLALSRAAVTPTIILSFKQRLASNVAQISASCGSTIRAIKSHFANEWPAKPMLSFEYALERWGEISPLV